MDTRPFYRRCGLAALLIAAVLSLAACGGGSSDSSSPGGTVVLSGIISHPSWSSGPFHVMAEASISGESLAHVQLAGGISVAFSVSVPADAEYVTLTVCNDMNDDGSFLTTGEPCGVAYVMVGSTDVNDVTVVIFDSGMGAVPITIGTAYSGTISAFDSLLFRFVPSTTGPHTISLTDTQSNLDWMLFTGGLPTWTTVLGECDTSPDPVDEICHTDTVSLTAGQTYYLLVDEYDGAAGTYTLTVNAGQSGTAMDILAATPLTVGTPLTGETIAASRTRLYSFTPASTGTYTIGLTALSSDLGWLLYPINGNPYTDWVADCDTYADATDEVCSASLTAGTEYLLVVDEWDGVDGTFTVEVVSGAQ